ncbi:MAG: hypothetical protein GY815_04625 [Gammaproteobacteria bacterium]|nr:hypothetical protein [Gammaproteobacteria bacterium]
MADLVLRAWHRSALYDNLDGSRLGGRLQGEHPLALFDPANPADRAEGDVEFVIDAPRDVIRLGDKDIASVTPVPGTMNAETTKAVHVEFRDADLPWRHTPQLRSGQRLRPWLALLVGATDEITIAGDIATVSPAVLDDHDLAGASRWAHLDEGGDRPVSRLLSPRVLAPKADHIAILVRAFGENGTIAWTVPAAGPAEMAVLHHWRFRTDDIGDFVSLAARLSARVAPPELGRAALHYDRIAPEEVLEAYGALAPIGVAASVTPAAVSTDIAALRVRPADPRGRPVIGLPDYGRDWLAQGANTIWSDTLNQDPRFRIAGGLGRRAGIVLQHEIVEEAESQAGALDLGHRLIADASLGLAAAGSLFARRLPGDDLARLWVLGPGMRKVATQTGTVYDRLASDNRPMPSTLLSSSAARRLFRPGSVVGRRALRGAVNPVSILREGNRCPPKVQKAPPGLPHADKVLDFDTVLKLNSTGRMDPRALIEHLRSLDVSDCPLEAQQRIKRLAERNAEQAEAGADLPFAALIKLINLVDSKKEMKPDEFLKALALMIETFPRTGEGDDLDHFGSGLIRDPSPRPCRPTDLGALSDGLTAAFDPNSEQSGTVVRLRDRVNGLAEPFLQPARFCPEIDLPLWRWMRDDAPDWLMPGVQALQPDDVTAIGTNPRFVDGFMIGANRQALAEFRWRNLRVASGCTPLKRFWEISEPSTGLAIDTIQPIRNWPADSALGAISHQQPSAGAADLVLVFRSPLFERYPGTVVYLLEAPTQAGEPYYSANPDLSLPRTFPVFQGKLENDVTFFGFDVPPAEGRRFWVVLEEAAPAYRFRTVVTNTWPAARIASFNAARNNTNVDGAIYARDTFNDPVRVLIRGTALVPEVA